MSAPGACLIVAAASHSCHPFGLSDSPTSSTPGTPAPAPAVPPDPNAVQPSGIAFGFAAYGLWGLLPIYWKLFQDALPAIEVLWHRLIWSALTLLLWMALNRRLGEIRDHLGKKKIIGLQALAGAIITTNWGLYIYSVVSDQIVEGSLGYFINPLVSVLLGVLIFNERLRVGQWIAVGIASVGVVYLTMAYGKFPWLALALAGTFAAYGVCKKKTRLTSVPGLTLETLAVAPVAVVALIFLNRSGQGHGLGANLGETVLILSLGVVTVLPLLFFAAAARRIPLSLIGLLQYTAPTLQFLIGVFIYHESFPPERAVGFVIVWTALVLFAGESVWWNRRRKQEQQRSTHVQ